jgi:hypothetical protein
MSADPNVPSNPAPMSPDELLAELVRENERLRRQVEDARHERDHFKALYLGELARNPPPLSADDLASAIPARAFIDQLVNRLERR